MKKIVFYFKKQPIILVGTSAGKSPARIIYEVLRHYIKISEPYSKIPRMSDFVHGKIFIIEIDFGNRKLVNKLKFFLINSSFPVIAITHIESDMTFRPNFLVKNKKIENIEMLIRNASPFGSLIFNYDEKIIRGVAKMSNLKNLTFGFSEKADFMASDVNEDKQGINFKLNYNGNSVPIWLNGVSGKNEIYNVLSAICVGTLLGFNVIELSDSIKLL